MNARLSAHRVLTRVMRDNAWSNLALMNELSQVDTREDNVAADKALTTELVYGVLRRQRLLDVWIKHLADKPKLLDKSLWHVLRIALYQLIFLDRIPAHAVLNEAGALCRTIRQPQAVGLVNAMLRRYLKELEKGTGPDFPADPVKRLAIEQSIPDWLMKRWVAAHAGDIERIRAQAEAVNRPAPLTLAVNHRRQSGQALIAWFAENGVAAHPGAFEPDALILDSGAFDVAMYAVEHGMAHVMDEAAQLVCRMADAQPGERILDLCAAPGGKSLHLAASVGPKGHITSVDISDTRLGLLKRQATAHGFGWIDTIAADATKPIAALSGKTFDRVLVDAPCSALGIIRRHPEIRLRRNGSDIRKLAETSHKILRCAQSYVKPGGNLLFSVCTTTPEEGPEQYAALLLDSQWHAPQRLSLPAELVGDVAGHPVLDTQKKPELDGFFAAGLTRP